MRNFVSVKLSQFFYFESASGLCPDREREVKLILKHVFYNFYSELQNWNEMKISFPIILKIILFLLSSELSTSADTMSASQSIKDGSFLVSSDGRFELGFFSPGSSTKRYVGIWYYNIPIKTVVWVANRENAINDSSGELMINRTGHLVITGQNNTLVWSANQTKTIQAPILQLLGTGNLVLRDEQDQTSDNYLWQSFDYPCDNLLPGMKLGWDRKSGLDRRITSWKSPDDPAPGDFTWRIDFNPYPGLVVYIGSKEYYRDGPWNGERFTGAPELKPNNLYEFKFISNQDEIYYTYILKNKSIYSRLVMNQTTLLRDRFAWNPDTQTWRPFISSVPRDNCDKYALCGANRICNVGESPICQCLKGFTAKSPDNLDWTQRCVPNKAWSCQDRGNSGFMKLSGIKLPDTTYSWLNTSFNIKECKHKCLENCNCTAYTNSDIIGSSGCALWFGDLLDIRQFASGGQDLFIRLHAPELGENTKLKVKLAVTVASVIVAVCSLLLVCHYVQRFRRSSIANTETFGIRNQNNESQTENLDLPYFDLATIVNATGNFSSSNKIGEGGFGPVYRGTLADGKEIAVKRLSRSSGQGLNEFKNEVMLIAKLQHRNLVKLLSCCIQGEENMLIYEYMPNRSLDLYIFDQTRRRFLDWSKRFQIICGIARGLLYLHQDSRLRIIHRDLKASNVLLDEEMIPKISDFGMARSFKGEKGEWNTERVVGTYGYMAPEYAADGLFSVKSDVFSFGILLLEIIGGKRNRGLYHLDPTLNLIRYAWRLWTEGRPLELIDPCLEESGDTTEVLRCIHVGLLCVQEHPEDRPNMSYVVMTLSHGSTLPEPKQPGFSIGKKPTGVDSSSSKHESSSTNEITVTYLEPR